MDKVAAIDIGTNSIRMMLCEVSNNNILHKEKYVETTRIGENVSKTGEISESAIIRNINALRGFKNKLDRYGATKVMAIATSAVREAINGSDFVLKAKEQTQIDIEVISGSKEAELGIIAVHKGCTCTEENILLIDIGGGSTELICSHKGVVKYSESINVGAIRMTEHCINSNPVPVEDVKHLNEVLRKRFYKQLEVIKKIKIDKVVGIGGTTSTLAAIFHKMSIYDSQKVHNTVIQFDFLQKCINTLANMSIEQRHSVIGLQKQRADIIVAGLLILKHLLKELGMKEIIISDNDNLEGIVLKYMSK